MSTGRTFVEGAEPQTQRLDKWLWYARFAKTRSLSTRLIEDGKVRVNRERITKPSHAIREGDIVSAALGGRIKVVKVIAIGVRRGPATEARQLYEDHTPAIGEQPARTGEPPIRPLVRERGAGRPTKRDRRKLDALRRIEPLD